MLLTEDEIRQAINQVKDTFPSFSEWDYNNEINDSYCGFSVWGNLLSSIMIRQDIFLLLLMLTKTNGKDIYPLENLVIFGLALKKVMLI